MSIRKRIEQLEGAVVPWSRLHLVYISTWPLEEQRAYDAASEWDRRGTVRAHLSDERADSDIVVVTAIPRPWMEGRGDTEEVVEGE